MRSSRLSFVVVLNNMLPCTAAHTSDGQAGKESSMKPIKRFNLSNLRKQLQDFRTTRFYPKARKQFCISWLPVLLFLCFTCYFCLRQDPGIPLACALCGLGLTLLWLILHWFSFYRTVIRTAPAIEALEAKYTLIDTEHREEYVDALAEILNIADQTIEREYSSKLLQRQAELDAMKSQINPHFLYNTLDTIRGYAVMEGAPITGDMIEVLSRLFRYTVSRKKTVVSLSEEISLLYDYIKIQEYRINQRITVIQNYGEGVDLDHYKIPKLVIQPLVENAIKHGTVGISHDFTITISVYPTNYYLIVSVRDNGCGMLPERLAELNTRLADDELHMKEQTASPGQKSGTGVALSNINQRIKIIYGKKYGLRVYSVYGEGSDFQLLLPPTSSVNP